MSTCNYMLHHMNVYTCSTHTSLLLFLSRFFFPFAFKYLSNQKYNKSQESFKSSPMHSYLITKKYIWMLQHVATCGPWVCDQNVYACKCP